MGRTVIFIGGRDPMLFPGGLESFIRAYGRAAMEAGYEPRHFCVGTGTRVEATPFGVLHVAKTPYRPLRGILVAAHGRCIVKAIDRFVTGRGPYLIHSLGPWASVGAAAAQRLARRGIDCVTVATPYSTFEHETLAKIRGISEAHGRWMKLKLKCELAWIKVAATPSERRGLRLSRLVLVNYRSVEAIVRAAYGDAISFGHITYASEMAFKRAETEAFATPAALATLAPASAPLIVAVSRHDTRKGIDVLLRALARLRDGGVPFRACLVGGGPLLERHRAYAVQLGLGSSIVLTGRVPDAFAYLKCADIFALPSLEEGSGSLSLLEAMQVGAAPVVSRIDGIPEDVTDGESALMAAPGDVEDLAQALGRVLGDAALRARLARQAQTVYRARFSADAFAAALRDAYTRLGFPPADAADGADAFMPAAAAAG
jgi:glycosyltransferase involved in cell wall biosynthesis